MKKLAEEKKKNLYGGEEKKAGEIKKSEEEAAPYFGGFQREFASMVERFQREFDDWLEMPAPFRHRRGWMMPFRRALMPSIDLEDRGKEFHLTVDLPGFSKENVDVEMAADWVTISAPKRQKPA
jgi:HSP20 family molecular chaperone IbpA